MSRTSIITMALLILMGVPMSTNAQNVLQTSRANCVQVQSPSANTSGSGFFLDSEHIGTCFHVAANLEIQGTNVKWQIHQDLRVILANGDTINAVCISQPTNQDPSPLLSDFAILKLSSKPSVAIKPNALIKNDTPPAVGDEVVFSGYPLATPAMVTHKGMISGVSKDANIICIQAAINKGNSGGALLNSNGEVIGIISMREGGITQGLMELTRYIESTEKHGSVKIMGVDPLQSTKEIINVLDTYISTGIGYAITVKHLRQYIDRHPIK